MVPLIQQMVLMVVNKLWVKLELYTMLLARRMELYKEWGGINKGYMSKGTSIGQLRL